MDYYELLGVSKSASEKDLKSAFKKKAMQYHPDKGGDPDKFKEINEAYQVLSDTQKRQMYDQFGTADPQQVNQNQTYHFNAGNMNDMFNQMFGGMGPFGFGGPQRQRTNKNIRLNYTIDFKNVFTGAGNTITFNLPSGRTEILDVRIPEGVKDGDTIRFQGYGDDSIPNLPRGDLEVSIRVKYPPGWRRDGNNIYTKVNINMLDLLTGTKVDVNTPEGKSISLTIPAGTNPGTTFSINGYGIPVIRTTQRGNLYVEIGCITPKLQDRHIQQIQKIKRDVTK